LIAVQNLVAVSRITCGQIGGSKIFWDAGFLPFETWECLSPWKHDATPHVLTYQICSR